MRITGSFRSRFTSAALAVFLMTAATETPAPPGGGGPGGFGGGPGGFGRPAGGPGPNRVGPATGGSFTSTPAVRHASRPAQQGASPIQPPPRSAAHLDNSGLKPRKMRESYAGSDARARDERSIASRRIRDSRENLSQRIPDSGESQGKRLRDAREDRRNEVHDEYRDSRRYRDAVYTEYDFSVADCEDVKVVGGITYYGCGGAWYRRAYSGGTVNYTVVDRPEADVQ